MLRKNSGQQKELKKNVKSACEQQMIIHAAAAKFDANKC